MNPLYPFKQLLHAVGFLLILPFKVIGMVFQGIWMLLTSILSVAVFLLAVAFILAAFAALVGAPFWFYMRSQHRAEAVGRRHVVVAPYASWNHARRLAEDAVYVDLHGHRLRINGMRAEELAPPEAPAPPQPPQVPAEIDCNDVDFSELGTNANLAEAELLERLSEKAHGVARIVVRELLAKDLAENKDPGAPAPEAAELMENRERPDWVDAIFTSEDELSKIRVEAGPCVSREACEMAYRDAQHQAIADYVRDRSEICLADLGLATMPWHELTVQRIAQNLRLRPVDEYADTHDVALAGEAQRTYFQYGLLEFSPEVRDHIDREITRWARSFVAGGAWGVILGGIGGAYLLLQSNFRKKLSGMFSTRRRAATLAVATVLGVALAALTAIL